MSHISTIKVEVKDLEALKKACKNVGVELMLGQTSYKWFAGKTSKSVHAIRVPNNEVAYEIGLVNSKKTPGAFEFEMDNFSQGKGMNELVGHNAQKLHQEYSSEVALKAARRQGFRVQKTIRADGSYVLTASR